MAQEIPVVSFGLGPIGRQILRLVLQRAAMRLVGAVDVKADLIGKDIGDVLESDRLGVTVVPEVSDLSITPGTIALHATGSSLAQVAPQLEALAAAGCHVVSTCEELSYPWFHQSELAQRIDDAAQAAGVVILGTGVNPGFAMDTLPLIATAVSRGVAAVRVERRAAAAQRREPLQRKIGAALTPEQFNDGVRSRKIRHVGLPESAAAVAAALGWSIDRIDEAIEPVIADQPVTTAHLRVEPGQATGVHQTARAFEGDTERVTLELVMAVSVPASVDTVRLEGDPPLTLTLEGIPGDDATAAIVVNAINSVRHARPGLRTMADIPLVHR